MPKGCHCCWPGHHTLDHWPKDFFCQCQRQKLIQNTERSMGSDPNAPFHCGKPTCLEVCRDLQGLCCFKINPFHSTTHLPKETAGPTVNSQQSRATCNHRQTDLQHHPKTGGTYQMSPSLAIFFHFPRICQRNQSSKKITKLQLSHSKSQFTMLL